MKTPINIPDIDRSFQTSACKIIRNIADGSYLFVFTTNTDTPEKPRPLPENVAMIWQRRSTLEEHILPISEVSDEDFQKLVIKSLKQEEAQIEEDPNVGRPNQE